MINALKMLLLFPFASILSAIDMVNVQTAIENEINTRQECMPVPMRYFLEYQPQSLNFVQDRGVMSAIDVKSSRVIQPETAVQIQSYVNKGIYEVLSMEPGRDEKQLVQIEIDQQWLDENSESIQQIDVATICVDIGRLRSVVHLEFMPIVEIHDSLLKAEFENLYLIKSQYNFDFTNAYVTLSQGNPLLSEGEFHSRRKSYFLIEMNGDNLEELHHIISAASFEDVNLMSALNRILREKYL